MFFDPTPISKTLFDSTRAMIIVDALDKTFALLTKAVCFNKSRIWNKNRYITVAYILSEASEKLCNSTFVKVRWHY